MMESKDKLIYFVGIFLALCWLIYTVRSVLSPFIFSFVIAYFLNPLVNKLVKKYKLSRLTATSLILSTFIIIFSLICAILLPIIYTQTLELATALPQYIQTIVDNLLPKVIDSLTSAGFKVEADATTLLSNKLNLDLSNILHNAFNSSIAAINILSLIFITPILIFYLLKDWNILIKNINDYLPKNISNIGKKIITEINEVLTGYVKGQFNVCLLLGAFYSIALGLSGLDFGFLIGFLTGVFCFIPYLGMLAGVTVATIVALFQWGFDHSHLATITLIFTFGQLAESNFLTPKIIGSKVGLNPVWVILGFFVFGALFGFVGVLISVPLTAICGTIIRHFALEYKKHLSNV